MGADGLSEHPRSILSRRGLAPRRGLGQNFLVSRMIMEWVVQAARVQPGEAVLEIGAGLGRLTAQLAERAGAVVAVEVDAGLCEAARERLDGAGNVTLLCCDFLERKHRINAQVTGAALRALEELAGPGGGGRAIKVVANLPYGISGPAIVNLLEWEVPVREIDVMLQAEVAARLVAQPGTPEYGPLTVLAGYWSAVERLFRAPASAFWPQPAVSSSFVRLTPRTPQPRARSYALFSEVVRGLFQHRRKTLERALVLGWGRASAEALTEKVGLDPGLRPGRLRVADFVALGDALVCLGDGEAGGQADA